VERVGAWSGDGLEFVSWLVGIGIVILLFFSSRTSAGAATKMVLRDEVGSCV